MKFVLKHGRAVKIETAPVTNCDDCGACCRHIGTPPGYAAYYPIGGEIEEWKKEQPDYQRWLNLPLAVEADLRIYYDAVKAGTIDDRTREYKDFPAVYKAFEEGRLDDAAFHLAKKSGSRTDIPCLWYDGETKRCLHYEHRPEVCRGAIAPGDKSCLATRKAFRIPLPVI